MGLGFVLSIVFLIAGASPIDERQRSISERTMPEDSTILVSNDERQSDENEFWMNLDEPDLDSASTDTDSDEDDVFLHGSTSAILAIYGNKNNNKVNDDNDDDQDANSEHADLTNDDDLYEKLILNDANIPIMNVADFRKTFSSNVASSSLSNDNS